MVILGALVNGIAAIVGGLLGVLLGQRVPKEMGDFLMVAIGLAVILTGVQGMVQGGSVLLVTLAMTLGGIIGYAIDIDGHVRRFGERVQDRLYEYSNGNEAFKNIARGFVNSTLVICIGSMAIVGSLESGLALDHSTLFAKSLMDMVINVLMAASMGVGVMLSGIVVFVYEALLSIGAGFLAPFLSDEIINEMLVTGSLLLFSVGCNLSGITDIKVANLLPACFLPIALVPLMTWLGLL
jgi:uncharacterized membrane protein YqgA involved in biofilm formation